MRRPFSVSEVVGTSIFFMYKVVGEGTKIMLEKKKGDTLNLLGPLGNSFNLNGNFEHLIIIGGGIGIAPFPFLIKNIDSGINYSVLFGVRIKSYSKLSQFHRYSM